MKKSEMTCTGCIKFDGSDCRTDPKPALVGNPEIHWCAQGQWARWSERYQEMEPLYWGEWEDERIN